jgi:CobQ/CobB/MinD/ParA nucleotide binding domain
MISFDDSLPCLVRLVRDELGVEALEQGVFWRDGSGRLSFVTRTEFTAEARAAFVGAAKKELGAYADEGVLLRPDDLGETGLLESDAPLGMRVLVQDQSILLIERRFVGQDWLTPPSVFGEKEVPPIATFWSHKGGVGRTTALAVAAAHMARRGKAVLAIDLDLEAPGLGSVLLGSALLPEDRTPRYGTLDWYVENGLQSLEEDFLDDLIGVSAFGGSRGRVEVIPALGGMSQNHPANVIAKLARAYVEDPDPEGGPPKTFLDQTRDLVQRVSMFRSYDAILVDARAGLNESAAASLLGLGADILLFGLNTPQSMAGFRLLLAYLAGFLPATDVSTDWRLRLKMVHSKASADPDDQRKFRDRSYEIFAEFLYEEGTPDDLATMSTFNFDIDDPDAPHVPWVVLDDANFRDFDPLANPELLEEAYVERTFANFIAGLSGRLFPDEAE